MYRHSHFVVRLPSPLEQQKLLAEIVYRWVRVLHLLLVVILLLIALTSL